MKFNKIKGLIAAPFTPMNPDGSVNTIPILPYTNKLKIDGLSGVFICGTTGEGMLMTNEERKEVAQAWVNEQNDDFKVIVHVGTTSAKQSLELAAHAQSIGAYSVGCMGPMFLKPSRIDELVSFCAEIAAGAPDLPFYFYNMPSISGVELPMVEFIKEASVHIPNFSGIKFTHNNLIEMQQCLNLDNGKWDILHGYDELLLAGLSFGAEGAVGSTYNFMAPLYLDIIECFENGNIAESRKKQMQSVKIIEVLNKYGGAVVAGKALMKAQGIELGDCRLPLKKFNSAIYDNFIDEMKQVGLFEITNNPLKRNSLKH